MGMRHYNDEILRMVPTCKTNRHALQETVSVLKDNDLDSMNEYLVKDLQLLKANLEPLA